MKQKFYSPFFMLVVAVLLACCNTNTFVPSLRRAPDYDTDINKAYNQIKQADLYWEKGIYDSAYINYDKSKQLFAKHKDSLRLVFSLLKMADIQLISGDYSGCETTATEVLPFLTVKDTLKYHEQAYNLLGRCCRKLYNYKSANKYFNDALEVTKGSLAKSIVYNNIASVYKDSKDYYKALKILEELNRSDVVNNDKETKGRVLNNLGEIYYLLERPEAARFVEEGYTLRKKINDHRGILSSYLQLSELYSETNKVLSKDYAMKAYNLATSLKISDSRISALEKLMVKTKGVQNLQVTKQYLVISDSLKRAQLTAKNEFAKIKYDSKEAQDNLKKQQIKNQRDEEEHRFKVRVIIFGSVLVLLVVVVFFYIKRLRYKEEKVMQAYVTETRISKKIHDELANDMFEVMVYADTQNFAEPGQKQKLVKNLDNIYNKTRDISRESNNIDTGVNFPIVLKDMLADYKTEDINVMFIKYNSVDWQVVSKPKKIAVYRVLQELMVNMKKHSGADVTVLKFSIEGKKITIQYNDNGKGIDPDKIFFKNGLQNADTRMKSVNGSITFENGPEKGLKALIEFTV